MMIAVFTAACAGGGRGSGSAPLVSALGILLASHYPEMTGWQMHDVIEQYTCNDPPLLSPEIPPSIDFEQALNLGQ